MDYAKVNASAGPPQRIVSLLPSATEILFALGLGERIVGVTHECDFPPQARTKPQLTASSLPAAASSAEIDRHVRASVHAGSSLYALDAALLEHLAPDLIVTQELCAVCAVSYEIVARAAKRLHGDPRIISLEPSSLEDVFANIRALGELTGTEREALALVAALQSRLDALRAYVANRPHPRALILEWTDPPMSGGHWTSDIVACAGGDAVLANPGADSVVLRWADIAAADPDAIIVAPCGYDLAATIRAVTGLQDSDSWRTLRAVQAYRSYAVDGNAYLNRPGPRLVDTAELFASAFFGEGYGAALTDPEALRRV
ncbi:MAG: cobalamin-binding protein [Candidatus Eremiobacteraeota bacterium]|nr:cobalamin-binding protein [Candidatus Eremiobacteraeota bacterium]MBC5803928.1 cobalamin-binding protein [Candidatus Eremiobacteraeota bacterium]MBC5820880.1 cobalamin-binding protein [Candidatus Eremiobacteraeota bacterium]